jgi:hypothetical protein
LLFRKQGKTRRIAMNKLFCAMFLFVSVALPACQYGNSDDSNAQSDLTGDLVVKNLTSCTLSDIKTGVAEDDVFCIEILPGGTSTIRDLDVSGEAKTVSVSFADGYRTVATKDFSVVIVAGAQAKLDLAAFPGCDGVVDTVHSN